MKPNGLNFSSSKVISFPSRQLQYQRWLRCGHTTTNPRQRRGDFWSPKVQLTSSDAILDATALLTKAGFIRQAYAGVYQFLPLGLRVLEKLERLIDKHMRSVGASKVSLSNLSSQQLWQQSGRLSDGSELFKFEDGNESKWLLAPTHEEEMTTLVQRATNTPGDLPVRLYQIGRKYRDEKRPRGGLLRGKEFVMKDLYTFDPSIEAAHTTYHQVRQAYTNLFTELGVPFLEARADSGNMGGKLSHEYHLPNSTGEDTVVTCSSCDYAKNEEFVPTLETTFEYGRSHADVSPKSQTRGSLYINHFVSQDGKSLVSVITLPTSMVSEDSRSLINTHVIKAVMNSRVTVNTGLEEAAAMTKFQSNVEKHPGSCALYYICDKAVNENLLQDQITSDVKEFAISDSQTFVARSRLKDDDSEVDVNILRSKTGDICPQCRHGSLDVCQAIEVGHTFYLGTRYSSKFDFRVPASGSEDGTTSQPLVEMGCYGIGVSRIIAASVACLAQGNRITWPKAIAPFDVVLCTNDSREGSLSSAHRVYDALSDAEHGSHIDVLLDDRQEAMGYKIKDADFIGYPIRVVFGRALDKGKVEVVCKALDVNEDVDLAAAPNLIRSLLVRL